MNAETEAVLQAIVAKLDELEKRIEATEATMWVVDALLVRELDRGQAAREEE